jgi:hypothetical protein
MQGMDFVSKPFNFPELPIPDNALVTRDFSVQVCYFEHFLKTHRNCIRKAG